VGRRESKRGGGGGGGGGFCPHRSGHSKTNGWGDTIKEADSKQEMEIDWLINRCGI